MTKPLDDLDFTHLFGPAPPSEPERDPFGRIGPGDPAWEAARGAWMNGAPLGALFGDRLFDLNDSVGGDKANKQGDVFKLQALLHREGALDATATGGPTGYWSRGSEAALRDFQKQNGLTVDGWAGPGGETISFFRDLYRPPQGLQVPEEEMRQRATVQSVGRDLAGQLALDPEAIDFADPAVLPALGGVAFIRYGDKRQREAVLQKVQALRASDPKLAGKLQALAAEIVSQPQWHYDKRTPEELQQALEALHDTDAMVRTWHPLVRRLGRKLLPKAVREVERRILRPTYKAIVRDEDRRLREELDRRRDPRDR